MPTILSGLEIRRNIWFGRALFTRDFQSNFLSPAVGPIVTEYERPSVRFEDGYTTEPFPPSKLRGAVTVETGLDQLWSLNFTVDDRTRVVISGGLIEDPSQIFGDDPERRPWASMYGRPVKFEASYISPQFWKQHFIFEGIVTAVKPSLDDDGDVRVTISAQSVNWRLTRNIIRRIFYPSIQTQDRAQAASEAANATGNPDLARIYNRSWAQGRPQDDGAGGERRVITLGEIISNIVTKTHAPLMGVDIDPLFFENPYIYTDKLPTGQTKQIAQENQTDWQFLVELAKDNNAHVWIEEIRSDNPLTEARVLLPGATEPTIIIGRPQEGVKFSPTGVRLQRVGFVPLPKTIAGSPIILGGPITGRFIRFKQEQTMQAQQKRISFVFNTQFGDGKRRHFVGPEDVDLNEPTILPMFGIQMNMDLVFAAPAARGYYELSADGAVRYRMDTRAPGGGYSYETLAHTKLYEKYRAWEVANDQGARATRTEEAPSFTAEEVKVFELMKEFGVIPTYADLLAGGFLTTEEVRAINVDSPDQEARDQYWRPNWTLSFTTLGTTAVKPGDLVELFNIASFMDGTWIAQRVGHTFESTWTTSITVARGVRPSTERPLGVRYTG